MENDPEYAMKKRIRLWLGFFMLALILSGLTAFPLIWEMSLMKGYDQLLPGDLGIWYRKVSEGLIKTDESYPFIAYGTDWLAFAHIVIALFFLAPFRDPVRYTLIIDIGILACVLVFPLAFICGPIRGIPFVWRLVDCSFGVGGILFLVYIRKCIRKLEMISNTSSLRIISPLPNRGDAA